MSILLVYLCLFLPPRSTYLWKYSLGFAVLRSRAPAARSGQGSLPPAEALGALAAGRAMHRSACCRKEEFSSSAWLLQMQCSWKGSDSCREKARFSYNHEPQQIKFLYRCSSSFMSLRYPEWFILFTHLVAGLSITNASSVLASEAFLWDEAGWGRTLVTRLQQSVYIWAHGQEQHGLVGTCPGLRRFSLQMFMDGCSQTQVRSEPGILQHFTN